MTYIDTPLYSKIVTLIPIMCVDIIVTFENEYIMVKRKENPLKGAWWTPGGRVLFGEKLHVAVRRKLQDELNLVITENVKLVGLYEDFFDRSEISDQKYHTISAVFQINISDTSHLKTDSTSECWGIQDSLPDRFLRNLSYL